MLRGGEGEGNRRSRERRGEGEGRGEEKGREKGLPPSEILKTPHIIIIIPEISLI